MRFTLDGDHFELTPTLVRARLAGHVPEDIREYWVEIDGTRWPVKQVISLATGVSDRQRFQSQSARRWLRGLGFTIGRDTRATTASTASAAPALRRGRGPTTRPTVTAVGTAARPADIVLLGCVKTKLDHAAPAKDLYVSDYFAKMRAYAEATGRPWFILSAEHGLVGPDEWLEPYERYLPDTPREYRTAWGEKVAVQLEQAVGPLTNLIVDVHAGAAYVESVADAVTRRGARVLDQLAGLSFGRRLSWYLGRGGTGAAQGSTVLAQLQDEAAARPLNDLIAGGGAGLRTPGMYSWWVDEAGANDLSSGLGHPVRPGLVYAGLAGATRSGGARSLNTLWDRIAGMHLGNKHQFSTLRRSLGSIIAEAHGRPVIDEAELTRWMYAHLRVIAIPIADVDTLDQLESEILTVLDPPLNLAKVPRTALRARLSALRKK